MHIGHVLLPDGLFPRLPSARSAVRDSPFEDAESARIDFLRFAWLPREWSRILQGLPSNDARWIALPRHVLQPRNLPILSPQNELPREMPQEQPCSCG